MDEMRVASLFLLLASIALVGAMPAFGEPVIVNMSDSPPRFSPERIAVTVGATIEWRNVSQLPHTVTADPLRARTRSHVQLPSGAKPFHSGDLKPGQTFRHTFNVPGDYHYICTYHEWADMVGTVSVRPKETAQ